MFDTTLLFSNSRKKRRFLRALRPSAGILPPGARGPLVLDDLLQFLVGVAFGSKHAFAIEDIQNALMTGLES